MRTDPVRKAGLGVAQQCCDRVRQRVLDYEAFRARLIARISSWERANPDGGDFRYYRCWLAALEDELADRGLVARGDLAVRSAALASRPAGHDHGHEHDNGHGHG
jgi:hypothetical protein